MANRVVIRVLGSPLAPYSSSGPLGETTVSEDWHVTVATQLGRFEDTSAAVQTAYPRALAYGYVNYQDPTTSNHWKSVKVYITISAASLDTLANA